MTIFYVDPTGADTSAGTSPQAPWASISKVNSVTLSRGDTVLLRGGASFSTGLIAQAGVTYGSYNQVLPRVNQQDVAPQLAILDGAAPAGAATGISLTGVSDVTLQDLEVRNFGFLVSTAASGAGCPRLTLQRCNLHACQVAVRSQHGLDDDWRLLDLTVTQCTLDGVSLLGDRPLIARSSVTSCGTGAANHANVWVQGVEAVVRGCEVGFNTGGWLIRHSGADNLIELNAVHDGPTGIDHAPLFGASGVTRVRYNKVYAISGTCLRVSDTGGLAAEHVVAVNNTLKTDGSTTGIWASASRGSLTLANNSVNGSTALTALLRVDTVPTLGLRAVANNWFAGAGTPTWIVGGTSYGSLTAYQTGTGQGQGDVYANPLMTAAPSFVLPTNSPALQVGVTAVQTGAGLTERWVRRADNAPMHYDTVAPDLGADQYLPVPPVPTPADDLSWYPKDWQDGANPTTGELATPVTATALEDIENRAAAQAAAERDRLRLLLARRPPAPTPPAAPRSPLYGDLPGEVQTVSLTGTVTGGSFTLTFSGQTTVALASSASATTIQTALQTLSSIGSGNVAVTGAGPWAVTFQGNLAGVNTPLMTATSSLTGTSPGVSIAETSPVRLVTDGATLTTALASAGSTATTFVLADGVYDNVTYWSLTAPHRFWCQRSVDNVVLTAGFSASMATSAGPEWHGLTFNVTDATKTFSSECINVTGSTQGAVIEDCVFDGGSTFSVQAAVRVGAPRGARLRRLLITGYSTYGLYLSDAAVSVTELVTLTGATGGTFALRYQGQDTAALAFNASATTVQTALQGLSTIGSGNVAVTGSAGGPFTVTFAGALAGANVDLLLVNAGALTGATPTAAVAFAPAAALVEDIDVSRIFAIAGNAAQSLGGGAGSGQVGVLLGDPVTARRIRVQDCGVAGVATLVGFRGLLTDVDVSNGGGAGILLARGTYAATLTRLRCLGRHASGLRCEARQSALQVADVTVRDSQLGGTAYALEARTGTANLTLEALLLSSAGTAGLLLQNATRAQVSFCDFTELPAGVPSIVEQDVSDAFSTANAGNVGVTSSYGAGRPQPTSGQYG